MQLQRSILIREKFKDMASPTLLCASHAHIVTILSCINDKGAIRYWCCISGELMSDILEVLRSSSTSSYQAIIAGGLALTLHMIVKVVFIPLLMLMSPSISISLGGTAQYEMEKNYY